MDVNETGYYTYIYTLTQTLTHKQCWKCRGYDHKKIFLWINKVEWGRIIIVIIIIIKKERKNRKRKKSCKATNIHIHRLTEVVDGLREEKNSCKKPRMLAHAFSARVERERR